MGSGMSFTAEELEAALKSDGNLFNGEKDDDYNIVYNNIVYYLWYDAQPDSGILDVLGIGEFRIADAAFGRDGPLAYSDGYSVWENYIVLEKDGRFFKLSGSYNSWDSEPWDGKVKEVKPKEKIVKVWE